MLKFSGQDFLSTFNFFEDSEHLHTRVKGEDELSRRCSKLPEDAEGDHVLMSGNIEHVRESRGKNRSRHFGLKTLEETAEALGLTAEQVEYAEASALNKLRNGYAAHGFNVEECAILIQVIREFDAVAETALDELIDELLALGYVDPPSSKGGGM